MREKLSLSRRALCLAAGAFASIWMLGATSGALAQDAPAGINTEATIQAAIAYGLSGTFDPLNASGAVTVAANWHVFEGLVDLDPATRVPYAALAAEMPVSEDGLNYTIKLREGAVFHNGAPVTADDVVFSFERVLDPESKSLFRSFVAAIDKVEAVSADTVKITTKFPFSLFNERLGSVKIVPRAAVEADADAFGKQPIGTGPYKLISAVPEDRLRTQRRLYRPASGAVQGHGLEPDLGPERPRQRAVVRYGDGDRGRALYRHRRRGRHRDSREGAVLRTAVRDVQHLGPAVR